MTAAIAKLIDALRDGVSRHELAVMSIHACIDEGIDTRGRIVETLVPLGFDYRHIAIMLKAHCGNSSEHHWRKDGDRYVNRAVCCS